MWPVGTYGVAWSVGLSVGRSVCLCNGCDPCKNGWTVQDAVWDVDSGGPKELYLMGFRSPHRKEHCWGGMTRMTSGFSCTPPCTIPSGPDVGIPRMLLTNISIGRLQKQSSVTLNFPNEKAPLQCGLLDYLLLLLLTIYCHDKRWRGTVTCPKINLQ